MSLDARTPTLGGVLSMMAVARRPVGFVAVLACVLLAPAAAAPLSAESPEARSERPTHRPPTASFACQNSAFFRRCHSHAYRATATWSAQHSDVNAESASGVASMTITALVRVVPKGARGRQPESTSFSTYPTKPIKLANSGTMTGPDQDSGATCTSTWRHSSGRAYPGGTGGNASLIRGGARVYRYSFRVGWGFETSGGTRYCGNGTASSTFRQNHGSYDVVAKIGAGSGSPTFSVELNFVRWQRAGHLAFPMNRLEEGKGFVLDVKGHYKDNVNTSSAKAHVVFVPLKP